MKVKKLIAIFLPALMSISSYNSIAMDEKAQDQESSVNLLVKDQQNVNVCVICQEKLNDEGDNKLLPCAHVYHESCIDKWLEKHNICPICKYQVPSQTDDEKHQAVEQNSEFDDVLENSRRARCQEQTAQCLQVGCFIGCLLGLSIVFGKCI